MKDEYEPRGLKKMRDMDMSPEDVAEDKAAKKATEAYNKAMPEADTTFGKLKKFASNKKDEMESAAKNFDVNGAARTTLYTNPVTAPGIAAYDTVKALREEGKNRKAPRLNEMGDAYKKGGSVGTASSRADGIAQRGKTRGTFV